MIVVAGGTGTLGTRLVPCLAGAGLAVRVLTRDPARAQHLGPGVDVARGDVRDPASIGRALRGAGTVISAVHGFTGPGGVCPASVDRAGNANLIDAATAAGAAFVLISVVGACAGHPIGLFRAKHAAEETLRASRVPWTIIRATAFMQTWSAIMSQALRASGKIPVFGRGDNPVNFVSATDVAALAALAVTDPSLRGQVVQLGGPDNLDLQPARRHRPGNAGAPRHRPAHPAPGPAGPGMDGRPRQPRASPPSPRRAGHGHPRHDLRLRPRPACLPRPARDRHSPGPERPAEESLTPRSNKSPAKGAT